MKSMQHIRDITKESVKLSGPYVQDSLRRCRLIRWNSKGKNTHKGRILLQDAQSDEWNRNGENMN